MNTNLKNSILKNDFDRSSKLIMALNLQENDVEILHFVCSISSPQLQMIKLLINKGLFINQKSKLGRNVMHFLCSNPSVTFESFEFLREMGADLNEKDKLGKRAIDYALDNKTIYTNASLMKILLNYIRVNELNESGNALLHTLCAKVEINMQVIKLVFENNADPKLKNQNQQSCLQIAFGNSNAPFELIEYLMIKGANLDEIYSDNGICVKTKLSFFSQI